MEYITVVIAVFIGGFIAGWWLRGLEEDSESPPCPHGYKDWDDCPDCSH